MSVSKVGHFTPQVYSSTVETLVDASRTGPGERVTAGRIPYRLSWPGG
jgi:hypothetical protein